MQWQLGSVPDRSLTVLVKAFYGFPRTPFGLGHDSLVHFFYCLCPFPHLGHDSAWQISSTESDFAFYAAYWRIGHIDCCSWDADQVRSNGLDHTLCVISYQQMIDPQSEF